MLTPDIESAFNLAAVLGVRTFVHPLGRDLPMTLGAEVAGGARGVQVNAESRHGACVVDDTTTYTRPMVEARGRADVWLTPRLALGAYAGADVITRRPSGGMILSAHLRAFDGAR